MVLRKFVLAGLLAILFSGCGGNQPKVSEKIMVKSVKDTSLQIVNKRTGNARVLNNYEKTQTDSKKRYFIFDKNCGSIFGS